MNTPAPDPKNNELPSLIDLIEKIKAFLAQALHANHPTAAEREATIIYKESEASRNRTDAVVAAFLSDWHAMVGELQASERLIDLNEVVLLLIHRTYNRMRRRKYRDDQMRQQTAAGTTRNADGKTVPFDPALQPWKVADAKELEETIALTVGDWKSRDRLIVYMHYFEERKPAEIVQRIKKASPDTPVSTAVVSRVLGRFRDELHRQLDEQDAEPR